jgi:hypothetical protein
MGLEDDNSYQQAIKKPACGRLLVGNLGIFLVNRNRLQRVP